MQSSKIIQCIGKLDYNNFCDTFYKTKELRKGKKIVIFGSGIMGLQFYYAIQEFIYGEEVFFCDNNPEKWGKRLEGRQILSPNKLKGKQQDYFVYLTMEMAQNCIKQLDELGYQKDKTYIHLGNSAEKRIITDFMDNNDAETLVLGDCNALTISLEDHGKYSLQEMLQELDKVKVIALNGLYMRSYYNLFLMSLFQMKQIKKIVLLMDVSIFYDKFHLYSKNQHASFFNELHNLLDIDDKEIAEFCDLVMNREKEGTFQSILPNRSDALSKQQIEQSRKMHMRLNYLYNLKNDTEDIQYLKLMLEECKKKRIECVIAIMPINFVMGQRYFGQDFYDRYEKLCNGIVGHVIESEGVVLDLSYKLHEEEFISVRTTNEGMTESGRRKVFCYIEEQINMRGK